MRRMLKTGLIIAALLAGAVAAYGYFNREEPEKVTVIKPSRLSVEESVTATGKVEASRTVLVTAEPGARIAAVHFREQQYVRKGDLLATIDDTEVVGQLSQHRANLALADQGAAGQDRTRNQAGAQRHVAARFCRQFVGDRDEARHQAKRIDHHQQRDQGGDEEFDRHEVSVMGTAGRSTGAAKSPRKSALGRHCGSAEGPYLTY